MKGYWPEWPERWIMMDQAIIEYGRIKGIRKRTLERWLHLVESDREALLDLAKALSIGENHLRDFLDWTDEMSLRDGVGLGKVLMGDPIEPIWTDSKLGRSDKLRRVKQELRRLRFPRLVQVEREIQKRIRSMGLKSEIQLTVPTSLEGGSLMVQLRSTSHEDLKRLTGELGPLLDRTEIKEIFDFLRGETV